MAYSTIGTLTNANRIAATVHAVFIRPSGELYQTLGVIKEGTDIVLEDYAENDSDGRNKSINSKSIKATITMMQCSLTEAELLATMCDGTSSFLFKMDDAEAIPTGGAAATAGWWVFSSTQIGVKPKVDLSGDAEKSAFITLEFFGSILNSALDAALKASIDDDDFEATGGSGTFKAIGTYTAAKNGGLPTPANIKSCGVATWTIADTGGATQTLGAPIDDPTIEMEFVGEQDSLKVYRANWAAFNLVHHFKQTNDTNILLYDSFSNREIDIVVTMSNGMVLTFVNQVGVKVDLSSAGSFERTRSFIFSHTGKVKLSSVNGIFS
jgi:hypothetical protein